MSVDWENPGKVIDHINKHVIKDTNIEELKWIKLITLDNKDYINYKQDFINNCNSDKEYQKTNYLDDNLYKYYYKLSLDQIINYKKECCQFFYKAKDGYSINYHNITKTPKKDLEAAVHIKQGLLLNDFKIASFFFKEKLIFHSLILYYAYALYDQYKETSDYLFTHIDIKDIEVYFNDKIVKKEYNIELNFLNNALCEAINTATQNDCRMIFNKDQKKLSRFLLVIYTYFKRFLQNKGITNYQKYYSQEIINRTIQIYNNNLDDIGFLEEEIIKHNFNSKVIEDLDYLLSILDKYLKEGEELPDYLLVEIAFLLFICKNKYQTKKFLDILEFKIGIQDSLSNKAIDFLLRLDI